MCDGKKALASVGAWLAGAQSDDVVRVNLH